VSAEKRYALEPVESTTPETLFERAWAEELLARVLERLREGEAAAGRGERFEQLKGYLTGDVPARNYGDLAAEWGVGEGAVRVAVHRLRDGYGRLVREEIAATLADPTEVGEELRHLLTVVGPPDPSEGKG
jgi:RNA polymerase sigma-70 factor (ECF subfamily)